jgi:hypothetical protein
MHKMDSSIKMNYLAQRYGESLMEAWSRIKDINKNSWQTLATLIKNFYGGLDEWSRSFPDSLTSGKFSSGDPSHSINLMDYLFGSSVKPIDELGIKQLKNSVDRAILELQNYMEECPTKNEISSFILRASSQFRKTKQTLSAISQKWKALSIVLV